MGQLSMIVKHLYPSNTHCLVRSISISLLLVISVPMLTHCNDAGFDGFSGGADKSGKGGKGANADGDPSGDSDPNNKPGVNDRDEKSLSGDITADDSDVCAEGGEVNVIMVFDNSGSQSSSDLSSMRQGATSMVGSLVNLVDDGKFNVHTATIRFSSSAIVGTYRWVQLGDGSDQDIYTDINQATADDGGNTQYASALNQASSLFGERGINSDDKNKRNFVVFLSDGKPDDDGQVQGAAQILADQYSAAMITIGTGGRNFSQLQSMASIRGSDFPKDHRGQFFQAENQSEVGGIFDKVFSIIDDLCKN